MLYPQMLPGGKSVLFAIEEEGGFQIAVQSLESGERKKLFPGWPAQYLPTGHLVYGSESTLTAIRFDSDTLETIGGPVPLVEGVFQTEMTAPTQSAISQSGTLVYIPGGTSTFGRHSLVWVDHEGKEELLKEEPKTYRYPKISPDGTRLALSITEGGNEDIWIYDLVRGTTTRLTFDEANDLLSIWTPDSKRIIFCSERAEKQSIFWKASDGTGIVEQIASVPDGYMWPWSMSNDGNTLFFGQLINAATGQYNIGMLSMEDERNPKLLLQERYDENAPQISPDGRWLAYSSYESGQSEVYIRPFPDVDSGGKWQVSINGGSFPLWSPDGKELYYRNPDAIMAVSVETEPDLKLGTPVGVFPNNYVGGFDIHPDGKRFLMMKESTGDETTEEISRPRINIVLNWFEELKDRVPVD